ncbi:hypothetical protein Zm00014a_041814 [Zea mays]|uniref:Smr domain-containing protein n=1 Tax=Zea mays TaxID=4577 RepID=A0A3L6DCW7_MAIZE|nr:hypothetical protein Zm00014a_041814 [Zea mays]
MAALGRLSRFLSSTVHRSGGLVRAFSMLAEVVDVADVSDLYLPRDAHCYYIFGKHEPLKLSSTRVISITEYFKEVSLLDRAPRNRLIEDIDDNLPFLIHDRVRKLLRSGLLSLYFNKTCGLSIPDTDFIEKTLPFVKLFKALVGKYAGRDAIFKLPKSLDLHFKFLELLIVKDYRVIYGPALFPKLLISIMYCKVHRLLREQCLSRGQGVAANAIMVTIEEKIFDFMKSCSTNALLISYSGAHGERTKKHIVGSEDGRNEALIYEVCDDTKDLKASNVPLKVRNFMGNKELSDEAKSTTAEGNVEIVPGDELTATLLDTVNTIQRTTGYGRRTLRRGYRRVMGRARASTSSAPSGTDGGRSGLPAGGVGDPDSAGAFMSLRSGPRIRNPVSSRRGGDRLIDIHGLHVNEAIHILKGELTALKSTARAAGKRMQVMVCVGIGHHPRGSRTARLPIAVEQFLLDEGLQYTQPQAGLLRVMVY